MSREWIIQPLDTLFFRDGMSFGMGETGWLESIFPPAPQTIQGFMRYAILRAHCKSDDIFKCESCKHKEGCNLPEAIGSQKEFDYGLLDIYGPYLFKDDKRYYPAPLDIMEDEKGALLLVPSDEQVNCDIGNAHLPATGQRAVKPMKGWISEDAFTTYLEGIVPSGKQDILNDTEFFEKEPKVGIKRKYESHGVETGMLYSIVPLRLREGKDKKRVEIRFRVNGIAGDLEPKTPATIKFGGEGKVVKLSIDNYPSASNAGISANRKIKMVLLQPADFDGAWYPCDFIETTDDKGAACWTGQIHGVDLKLISACTGKAQKIGGFDMARKENKPMRSYVPAGSVYYFEVTGGDPSNLAVEGKIGLNSKIGFGHYRLGRW
jgi:CRISPR-associated protein Cmr3